MNTTEVHVFKNGFYISPYMPLMVTPMFPTAKQLFIWAKKHKGKVKKRMMKQAFEEKVNPWEKRLKKIITKYVRVKLNPNKFSRRIMIKGTV